ncbi:MAG: hypothetical protein WAO74_04435 [Polaribacter sp.]|uniref:hypothetical protein n=1 Tax=Polaribacter sp. TaxID=1920175 RepID=UPI003BB1162B
MKKLIVLCLLSVSLFSFGQSIQKPKKGKALVYFIRSNAIGSALNFRVYDKDIFLGALPNRTYFAYECNPGKHLFWAASENRDYVEAELKAGKVYVIDLRAKIGLLIAAVGLDPYSPDNKTHLKRFKKALDKHTSANVVTSSKSKEKEENITKALSAYDDIKDKSNSKIKILSSNMNFDF